MGRFFVRLFHSVFFLCFHCSHVTLTSRITRSMPNMVLKNVKKKEKGLSYCYKDSCSIFMEISADIYGDKKTKNKQQTNWDTADWRMSDFNRNTMKTIVSNLMEKVCECHFNSLLTKDLSSEDYNCEGNTCAMEIIFSLWTGTKWAFLG